MEFTPFDGKLDEESSFTPFTGELDKDSFVPFNGQLDQTAPAKGGKGASSIPGAEAFDANPPKVKEDDLGTKSLGVLEGAATAITGGVAPFLGMFGSAQDTFRQGVKNLVTGNHDEQVDFRKRADEIAAGLTYQPRTETGQTIAENYLKPIGEGLQALGPLAPHFTTGGQVVGAKMLFRKGERAVEIPSTKLEGLDAAIAEKKASMAAAPESTAVQGPTLPNRSEVGNARTSVENPVAGGMNPMERMAADLAPQGERLGNLPTEPSSAMARTADELLKPTSPETRSADQVLARRQAELDEAMQKQVTLEQNARMRAQQEQASAYSPEYQQHVAAVEQAKQAQEQARQTVLQEVQAAQQEVLGSQARVEAQRRAAEAQRQLELRQTDLEMAVKRQTALDMNAAERSRQLNADAVSTAERIRMDAAAFETKKAQWAAEDARLAAEADKSARRHQMEIDDTQHAGPGEIYGAQYGTHEGMGRVDENGMPIRADLSMEAQNLQNPLQRNLWGDELGPALGQTRSLTSALDSLQHSPFKGDARDLALASLGEPRATFNTRTRKQGGGVYAGEIKKAQDESPVRWFTASPEHGRTKSYSLESQAARPNAEAQRYGPGQYIAQSRDFSSVYGGKEGRMYEVPAPFSRPFDVTKASNEKIYQSLVERTGSRAEANKLLQKSGYDAITFTSPRGDKLANIFNEVPLKDIGPAREKVRQQILTLESYEPGSKNDPFAKQRGMIRLPGKAEASVEKLKGIQAFRDAMKPLAVDRSTPEEFIAANKGAKDVEQNIVQKAFNGLTKGSIYLSDRLNNPLYSRVTARFREADSLAKGQQQAIVHDIYAPTIRALSDNEKAHVWGALKKMEESGVRIDDNKLVDLGFSQKERDAIKMHQTIMDDMIPKINAALDAAGLSHIHPQAAYMASKLQGTFRKVMLDKDNNVIGALGDRTRSGLLKQEAEFKKLHPEAVSGKEQIMGSRGNTNNMADLISFLSDKDPHMAEYLRASKEAGAKEAMNYRGAKTHTMEKKGVEGMAGNKPWESAVTNAREGFDAQVSYLNRMLEWAEKAKAEADVRPLLDSPELNMPNAKQMASDYRDFALGKNPYEVSKIADAVSDVFSSAFGGKLSYMGDLTRGTKKAVNIKLLAANPGFLAANVLQPMRNMPELSAFLKARGMDDGGVFGLGAMGKVSTQMATGKFSPILKEAMDYAEQHHVYASDLIDQRQGTGRAFTGDGAMQKASSTADALEHALQVPASKIEGWSRKTFFLTMVDMLHENGIRKQDGLFDIASNLTDRGMNRYSAEEAPIMIKALGSAGRLPYNLMSFKFNELSRVASLAREMNPKQLASAAPFLTALSMQVATAGIMGTMGYVEANEIVKAISKVMGQPTSLTKILLDHGDQKIVGPVTVKDLAYGGLSSATGFDVSGRMGVGALAGSSNLADVVLPGSSSLGPAVKSAYDFATNPKAYTAAKAAVDILPGGPLLDRQLFSKNKGTDKEMGFNRNRVESGVVRTPADKMAKNFGMTGVNESSKKTSMYENQQVDTWYQEKQKSAIESMGQDFFMDGKISPKSIEKFKKAQGNPDNLNKIIDQIAQEQNIPADKRDLLKAAAQASVNPNKIKRRFY